MEENGELYRLPRHRDRRTLADELAKFSLCFALSEHGRATGKKGGRKLLSGLDVAAIKAGILGETTKAGDEVEGEALASDFAAIYQPRAYYPAYFLGEMRAALRRGDEPPSASPHYLPVSTLPPLPDGSRIAFLFGVEKTAFDRADFPANVRDVLTRDYARIPMVLPPERRGLRGRIRFRARLLRLERDSVYRLAGIGERAYEAYSARGLTYFLQPIELEEGGPSPLRGSLFAEMYCAEDPGWERVLGVLEETVCETVAELFPGQRRGERSEPGCHLPHSGFHVTRFRRRFLALVFDPVIVIYRAPRLFGIYMPSELGQEDENDRSGFDEAVVRIADGMREGLGLSSPLRVDIAYDNRTAWARERKALRGPVFDSLTQEHPFIKPTLEWLTESVTGR
jgi:hypothetical protein